MRPRGLVSGTEPLAPTIGVAVLALGLLTRDQSEVGEDAADDRKVS